MKRRSLVAFLVLMTGTAIALTSCAGADQQGSPAHRMSVWVNGTGFGEQIGTLIADNARVAKDVPNGTGAVHAACSTIVNDADMANSSLPNSNGSQFFVVYKNSTLSPNYTPFGKVVTGLGIIQSVAQAGSDNANGSGDGHPKEPVVIERVTIKKT